MLTTCRCPSYLFTGLHTCVHNLSSDSNTCMGEHKKTNTTHSTHLLALSSTEYVHVYVYCVRGFVFSFKFPDDLSFLITLK